MNKLLATIFISLIAFGWANDASADDAYVKNGSIGAVAPTGQDDGSPIPTLQFKEWIGHKFIFLPIRRSLQNYGYQLITKSDNDTSTTFYTPYEDLVGKTAVLQSVSPTKYTQRVALKLDATEDIYYAEVSGDPPTCMHIALVSDIDTARKLWKGKALWCRSGVLQTYDEGKDTDAVGQIEALSEIYIDRCSKVYVVDIVAGWDNDAPVRFILKSNDGREGFIDIHASNTNTDLVYLNTFRSAFFDVNPRTLYKWPAKIWEAIESGRAIIGMTREQVRLACDAPSKKNEDETASGKTEQWVYPNQYVYFQDGKVSSITTLK